MSPRGPCALLAPCPTPPRDSHHWPITTTALTQAICGSHVPAESCLETGSKDSRARTQVRPCLSHPQCVSITPPSRAPLAPSAGCEQHQVLGRAYALTYYSLLQGHSADPQTLRQGHPATLPSTVSSTSQTGRSWGAAVAICALHWGVAAPGLKPQPVAPGKLTANQRLSSELRCLQHRTGHVPSLWGLPHSGPGPSGSYSPLTPLHNAPSPQLRAFWSRGLLPGFSSKPRTLGARVPCVLWHCPPWPSGPPVLWEQLGPPPTLTQGLGFPPQKS